MLGYGAHAMAAELHFVEFRPDADNVCGVYTDDELLERSFDQLRERRVRAGP